MSDIKVCGYFDPFNLTSFFASRMALLRPFATSKNKRGERGNPCLSPLFERKKDKAEPFMSTAKDVVEMQAKIHFIMD